MYSVSADYLTALASPVARFKLSGTVGSTSFTEDNIVQGTFSITNNCSEGNEIKLGSVYVGQLKTTFNGLSIARGSWIGKKITVSEGLQLADESYEYVPLGVFTISEAKHTDYGVEVTAYDNMTSFDKTVDFDTTTGEPYDFLAYICTKCGVTLANTQEEIETFPNGDETLSLYPENDVSSYRDAIFWIAQTLCAFATIDRTGKLELRQYSMTSAKTIDETHRFAGCVFSDFDTNYTGMSVVEVAEQFTRYYSVSPDNGLTYNLGSNPFLQFDIDLVQNIIDAFSNIELTPFKAQMIGGALFDLGDCLTFSGGIAQGAVCGVMAYNYKYNGGYEIEGFGENPALANARSKTDHDISGLMSQIESAKLIHYSYTNVSDIDIADGAYEEVLEYRFSASDSTWVIINAEIQHTAETTETDSSDYDENDLVITAKVYINSVLQGYMPINTEQDGERSLHLGASFVVDAGFNSIRIVLECDGGNISISEGGVASYLIGYGIGAQTGWDGIIQIDEWWSEDIQIVNMGFDDTVSDQVSVTQITPIGITLTEAFADEAMQLMTLEPANDSVTVDFVVLSATIDTSSVVVRSATYTRIDASQFKLKTSYTETSETEVIDSGYCTKVTPFITGLTVSDVEIV